MSATFQQGQSVYFLHPTESWVRGKVTDVSSGTSKQGKEEVTYTCAVDQEPTLLPTLKGPSGTVGKLPASSVHQLVQHATTSTAGGDDEDGGGEGGNGNKMFDPTGDDTYDDLLNLPYLHDSTLLEQVRKRYYANLIYTRIGPIILALNPYDYGLKNYVDANMPKYFAEGRQVVAAAGKSSNIPHAWTTAHYAYWLLSVEGENQSVIVSGESGAGKTETAKIVVKYLGNVSTAQCSETEREQATIVTHRVNATSPILEAFGNAKTVRNDNSSRFGKFMRVHFNPTSSSHPDAGHLMVGVSVVVYLLEKSRIVTHSAGERGYHSFYQLLSKDDKDDAKTTMLTSDLKLGKATEYDNLNAGKATVIAGVDDAADFNEVCRSMESIGLEMEERSQVWAVIGAVLHLLAVKFSALNVDECEIEGASGVTNPGTDPTAASGRRRAVSMSPARDVPCPERAKANSAHLEVVKGLIGVENMTPFVEELTTTATTMRNEKIVKRLKKAVAIDVRDAICKYMYESLFLWLVGKINDLIAPPPEAKDSWIALLDIFGFENFEHGNSFEQLCINLANETLQNHYNSIIFTRDMAECHSEGINTASVTFYDNQPCVDLICGVNFAMCGTQELQQSGKSIVTTPLSIMSLLDEECALGNGTDDAFVQKAITTFEKAPNFAFPKTERGAFVVKHYAGDVKYTVSGFRLKNKNTTKDSLREMLRASSKPFVGNLVNHADELQVIAAEEAAASGVAGKKGGATVSSFFKTQLVRLMSEINRTHPHWIRCVKPHSAKKPKMFHGVEVMTQMCSAGVLETVKIRQQGFSIRIPLAQFVKGAGRLLLQKLPKHTCTMLNRLAATLKSKTTALQSDLQSLTDRKLSANALAAKTNELQKQIDDITVEVNAITSFSTAVEKGTHISQSDDVKDNCRQVFENGSINHDSLAQVGVTKVFLRSDGFRILNSRTALIKTAIASSISAMARAQQSSSKVRCLQINEGFRRIQAALIARKSETTVRLLEKVVREKELVTKFRALLLLEAEEVKVRAATVVPEEEAAFEGILSASHQSYTAAQEAFQARMALVFASERAEVESSEEDARVVVISTEVSERALLLELAVIFSDEEKKRAELEALEAEDRHEELEVVGLQELRTSIADILQRELAASLETVIQAEEAARSIAETTAIEKWYIALRAFLVLHTQEDAARKYIESEESDMYDDSILEGHEAGWEELQDLWLEKKMLDDEEDRYMLEDEESAFRQEVEHEWQQRLILFHLRAGESFDRCKKIQAAMERAELLKEMEEERIREEEAARAHQQWVSEQREIAQAVWMAAVNVKRAKAKEDADKKKKLTEWQDRALKERERIRKLQQKEISSSSGLGARNKLQSTFSKGDPVVIERAKEAEKNKRVEALRKARQAAASQSQSPLRGTLNGGPTDPQLNGTVMSLGMTNNGGSSPLARTMGSPNATMKSGTMMSTTADFNNTTTTASMTSPCPNLNFEAANLKFSKLMTQLDEIGRAALTPRTKRGILLKVVRQEPEWTGDSGGDGAKDQDDSPQHHHHEDPESNAQNGHDGSGPEFVSIEEVDEVCKNNNQNGHSYNNIDNKQSLSSSPAPDRPPAQLPPGYTPSESELAFDRGASPLGKFLAKKSNINTPMQSLHATTTTTYSLSNTYNNHTVKEEEVDLFAAAATRRDHAANTLMATTTSRRSIHHTSSSRLVMNPFDEGWAPVANGSKAYLPDGTLIDL